MKYINHGEMKSELMGCSWLLVVAGGRTMWCKAERERERVREWRDTKEETGSYCMRKAAGVEGG